LLGVYLTGKVPFGETLCHAMIRNAHGRQMNKSLGNVIDPLDVIHGLALADQHQKLYEGSLDDTKLTKAIAGQKKDFTKDVGRTAFGWRCVLTRAEVVISTHSSLGRI